MAGRAVRIHLANSGLANKSQKSGPSSLQRARNLLPPKPDAPLRLRRDFEPSLNFRDHSVGTSDSSDWVTGVVRNGTGGHAIVTAHGVSAEGSGASLLFKTYDLSGGSVSATGEVMLSEEAPAGVVWVGCWVSFDGGQWYRVSAVESNSVFYIEYSGSGFGFSACKVYFSHDREHSYVPALVGTSGNWAIYSASDPTRPGGESERAGPFISSIQLSTDGEPQVGSVSPDRFEAGYDYAGKPPLAKRGFVYAHYTSLSEAQRFRYFLIPLSGGGIYVSDNAIHWTAISALSGVEWEWMGQWWSYDVPGAILAVGRGKFAISLDAGYTWTLYDTPGAKNAVLCDPPYFILEGNEVYKITGPSTGSYTKLWGGEKVVLEDAPPKNPTVFRRFYTETIAASSEAEAQQLASEIPSTFVEAARNKAREQFGDSWESFLAFQYSANVLGTNVEYVADLWYRVFLEEYLNPPKVARYVSGAPPHLTPVGISENYLVFKEGWIIEIESGTPFKQDGVSEQPTGYDLIIDGKKVTTVRRPYWKHGLSFIGALPKAGRSTFISSGGIAFVHSSGEIYSVPSSKKLIAGGYVREIGDYEVTCLTEDSGAAVFSEVFPTVPPSYLLPERVKRLRSSFLGMHQFVFRPAWVSIDLQSRLRGGLSDDYSRFEPFTIVGKESHYAGSTGQRLVGINKQISAYGAITYFGRWSEEPLEIAARDTFDETVPSSTRVVIRAPSGVVRSVELATESAPTTALSGIVAVGYLVGAAKFCAFSNTTLYKSSTGTSWDSGVSIPAAPSAVGFGRDNLSNDVILIGTSTGTLHASKNQGSSWTAITSGISSAVTVISFLNDGTSRVLRVGFSDGQILLVDADTLSVITTVSPGLGEVKMLPGELAICAKGISKISNSGTVTPLLSGDFSGVKAARYDSYSFDLRLFFDSAVAIINLDTASTSTGVWTASGYRGDTASKTPYKNDLALDANIMYKVVSASRVLSAFTGNFSTRIVGGGMTGNLVVWSNSLGYIVRSTDGGNTFPSALGPYYQELSVCDASANGVMLLSKSVANGVYVTASTASSFATPFIATGISFDGTQFLVFSHTSNQMALTTDGSSWTTVPAPSGGLRSAAMLSGEIVAVDDTGAVWKSTNNGATWTLISGVSGATKVFTCASQFVILTSEGKLYKYTSASGVSPICAGMNAFDEIGSVGNVILASAGGSVYIFSLTELESAGSVISGEPFEPVSLAIRSNVFTVCDGRLVLFGTVEYDEDKNTMRYYQRRIRWSVPLEPKDLFTIYASGLAELHGSGDFLTCATLGHSIVGADEGGIFVLDGTGEWDAPFAYRRIAEGTVPVSNMVALGDYCAFIGQDGQLWTASPGGVAPADVAFDFSEVVARARAQGHGVTLMLSPSNRSLVVGNYSEREWYLVSLDSKAVTSIDFSPRSDTSSQTPLLPFEAEKTWGTALAFSFGRLVPATGVIAVCSQKMEGLTSAITGSDTIQSSASWYADLVTGEVDAGPELQFVAEKVSVGCRTDGNEGRFYAGVLPSYVTITSVDKVLDGGCGAGVFSGSTIIPQAGAAWSHKIATGDGVTNTFQTPVLAKRCVFFVAGVQQTNFTVIGPYTVMFATPPPNGSEVIAAWTGGPPAYVQAGDLFEDSSGNLFSVVSVTDAWHANLSGSSSGNGYHRPTKEIREAGWHYFGVRRALDSARLRVVIVPSSAGARNITLDYLDLGVYTVSERRWS